MNILGLSGFDNAVSFKRRHFPDLEKRAYRIAQGFDSAAVLLRDGAVQFGIAEERITREKATGEFPFRSIKASLAHAGIDASKLDFVAHCFNYAPHKAGMQEEAFYRGQYDEVYDPALQVKLLEQHFPGTDWASKFVAVPHHLAHAASAFYQSGFKESLVFVSDGMGETDSMTVYTAQGADLKLLASVPAFHSLGVLYSAFTLYLGFDFNMDEYKVMGLAPFGDKRKYFNQVMELVRLKDDGTYAIPLFAQNQTVLERESHAGVLKALVERFGPARMPDGEMNQHYKDLAAAVQAVLQTVQLHVLRHFSSTTGLENLCMAGGVSLNCTANGIIKRSNLFDNVFVQPAAGDDGAALGAALYVQHTRQPGTPAPRIAAPLWGPEYSTSEVEAVLKARTDIDVKRFDTVEALTAATAERLERGEILGWFQGRMEFGPRALGCRSIIADPRPADMRNRVNMLIKKREGFRPFAPAVAFERASEYFEIEPGDEETFAHMLFVLPVKPDWRNKLHAITHVDGTARVQSVRPETNPRFYSLLKAFEAKSGVPMVLNTSFNVKGQPIVCTPTEAIDTFLSAGLFALVIDNFIVTAKK
ncbi:MAG TPA: carbamoyltransferase C-terminal domain-containing protein [Rhizobacter sp.]|nr:carbamoyltransferase C-terminal domain-containing protein [Rhizobacter sp.]